MTDDLSPELRERVERERSRFCFYCEPDAYALLSVWARDLQVEREAYRIAEGRRVDAVRERDEAMATARGVAATIEDWSKANVRLESRLAARTAVVAAAKEWRRFYWESPYDEDIALAAAVDAMDKEER